MDKKSILFLLLSIIILLVMLYFVGIENVIDALKVANLTYIIIAFGIQIFTFYLYTLRWQILNKLANINTGILKLLPMLMVGLAVNKYWGRYQKTF